MVGSSEFNFGKESKDRMRNPLNTLNTGSLEILLQTLQNLTISDESSPRSKANDPLYQHLNSKIERNDFDQPAALKGFGHDLSDRKKRKHMRNSRMSSLINSYPEKNVLALSYNDNQRMKYQVNTPSQSQENRDGNSSTEQDVDSVEISLSMPDGD